MEKFQSEQVPRFSANFGGTHTPHQIGTRRRSTRDWGIPVPYPFNFSSTYAVMFVRVAMAIVTRIHATKWQTFPNQPTSRPLCRVQLSYSFRRSVTSWFMASSSRHKQQATFWWQFFGSVYGPVEYCLCSIQTKCNVFGKCFVPFRVAC